MPSRGITAINLVTTPQISNTPIMNPATIHKMKTPSALIASAMGLYYGGMALDAIQQQFRQDHDLDMSESNYWNWVVRFTKEANKQIKGFKPENIGDTWVANETYMKPGNRTGGLSEHMS